MDGKIKAPTASGRMWVVRLIFLDIQSEPTTSASRQFINDFNVPSAIRAQLAILLDRVALI